MAVTPTPGSASAVVTGGSAVQAAGPTVNGIIITNPVTAADQGLGSAEPLYVDPTGAAALTSAHGTTFALQPGQSWSFNFGQSTNTFVNAASSGHRFTVVVF